MVFQNPELAIAALSGIALVTAVIITLAVYIYTSWAVMTIANKTKTQPAWLAWIPIANLFLIAKIAQVGWWTALIVIFAGWIPIIGQVLALAITVWWFWQIAERRNYEGWMGILMIIPLVNLVILGVLAWNDKK